ncbi:MAG: nucleotide-binding protein [Phycisphaerales bacterium]|nr:nucleotide-binding protein [Phycisphaerales bacterium]
MARKSKLETKRDPSGRKYLSQADVPLFPLREATKISRALAENFGYKPARPVQIAQALGVQPTTASFRMLCGSSIAYGLTDGGYNAAQIVLTPLGKRVVAPTAEGDDMKAMREAFLRPRVLGEFLSRYDGARLPREDIARNVLAELGVPHEATLRALKVLEEGARMLGLLREIKGNHYVDLQGTATTISGASSEDVGEDQLDPKCQQDVPEEEDELSAPHGAGMARPFEREKDARTRVFISHGKNRAIVDQVKSMLNVAEVEFEIAVEEAATAIPVPEKVADAMRKCNAAIICVTRDDTSATGHMDTNPASEINPNVLIEIGAAFVLYARSVILLWEKGVKVPSNLQGLYRQEFQGADLSWGDGMRLMEAIKKLRSTS